MKKAVIIAIKEWKEISRDYFTLGPVIFVPIIMTIILSVTVITNTNYFVEKSEIMDRILENMPQSYMNLLSGFSAREKIILMPIKMFGIPFFLLIPLMVTSIISADSFAGEKERKTIESLLLSPISDWELFFGKLLTSAAPALIASWSSFAIFTVVVSIYITPHFEKAVFPDLSWILTVIVIIPLLIILSVSGAVFISSKLLTVQGAVQLNFIFTLPVMILLFAQSLGVFIFTDDKILYVILGLILIDLVVLKVVRRYFSRESMLE